MPVDATELRRRRRRIEGPAAAASTPAPPGRFRGSSGDLDVVIVSTQEEVAAGTIMVRTLEYSTDPPEPDQAEMVGRAFRAYPFHRMPYERYVGFALGLGANDPLPAVYYPLEATIRKGHWHLKVPLISFMTTLNTGTPWSGCSYGVTQ